MYEAIGEISAASIIVDSSKNPADAYALSMFTDLDIRILHVVRDPRGVAYSWSQKKPNMVTWGPLTAATRWVAWNAALDHLVRPTMEKGYELLRYEDFAVAPAATVRRICEFAGAENAQLPFESERRVYLGPSHVAAGNPDRVSAGVVQIDPDERWRSSMARSRRLGVSLVAGPLLHRYGYSLL